jgi:hypothetical protein
MTPGRRQPVFAACAALSLCGAAVARPDGPTWTDPRGDAVVRKTDPEQTGPVDASTNLPDLISARLVGWSAPDAHNDPYTGTIADPSTAMLFRLDLQFVGVVNPPGPMEPFLPFMFGPSPLYGFLEIDVDNDRDTGGEYTPVAKNRYLANVGRFGRLPPGPIHERAVDHGSKIFGHQFGQSPQFEQSGADFALVLCGCITPEIVSEGNGNQNHIFEAGETWIVRGNFFQSAGGYDQAMATSGGTPGLYDPQVNLRFSHNQATNITTVTLVYAIDNAGSAALRGDPFVEPHDFDVGDQNSVLEALDALIWGVGSLHPGDPTLTLAQRWLGRNSNDYRDPTRWGLTALFGTSYSVQQPGYPFVWTDTGFNEKAGDVDGDGTVGAHDAAIIRAAISSLDGTPADGDGVGFENGSVLLLNPGINFYVEDVNGDGRIDQIDQRLACVADYNLDGRLDLSDFIGFLAGFAGQTLRADIDQNGTLDINDFVTFAAAFAGGCP